MAARTKQNVQDDESVLGFLASRVLLTLGYYLVLTPIAGLAKVLGITWMPLKADPAQASYWNQRSRKPASAASYEKQR